MRSSAARLVSRGRVKSTRGAAQRGSPIGTRRGRQVGLMVIQEHSPTAVARPGPSCTAPCMPVTTALQQRPHQYHTTCQRIIIKHSSALSSTPCPELLAPLLPCAITRRSRHQSLISNEQLESEPLSCPRPPPQHPGMYLAHVVPHSFDSPQTPHEPISLPSDADRAHSALAQLASDQASSPTVISQEAHVTWGSQACPQGVGWSGSPAVDSGGSA